MTDTPTFALPPSFLGLARHGGDARFVIAGVPFDIGTTNRSGARFGPAAIRRASLCWWTARIPGIGWRPAVLPRADIGDFANRARRHRGDALDPAFAPGTGTPEIGGLASWQAQAILRRLGGLDWVGMEVVEVAPAYDVAEITAFAAATLDVEDCR